MKLRKPMFNAVVDLGLRDVGVKNDPRRLAVLFGKAVAGAIVLGVLFVLVACVALGYVSAAVIAAFALAVTVWVAFQMFKRGPVVVWRIDASGTNRVTWVPVASFVLSIPVLILYPTPGVIVLVVLSALTAVLGFKGRGRLPEILARLVARLAPGERVLGDGIGMARADRKDPFRLIACTDRRVVVDGRNGPLIDVPYAAVTGFGIRWSPIGRVGTLSLTIGAETHVIRGILPLNLLSIARALRSHGVAPDDPAPLAEAEKAWAESRRPRRRPTLAFGSFRTRGLWLLLVAFAVLFHLRPLGMTAAVLPLFAMICLACGYLDLERAPVAHVLALVAVALPALAYMDALLVVVLTMIFGAIAGVCLSAGAALREARQPQPSSSPRSLLPVTMATAVAILVIGGMFGFDPGMVRLAMAQAAAEQLRVDGRSNLAGGWASVAYTPGSGLREQVLDEGYDAGPDDGARWEVRTPFSKGDNVVSLTHYVFDRPPLSTPAAVAEFVAGKDAEHADLAGGPVTHTERVIDGRTAYVWTHGDRRGYWYQAVWVPHPEHTIRLECIAREQVRRFQRLCAQATASLKLR